MSRIDLKVESTPGDFGRDRGGFPVACCSCTCCCLTFVGAGLGIVGGAITGIVLGVLTARRERDPWWAATLRVLVSMILCLIVGLLVGGTLGLGLDLLMAQF
jgi:hypothetical protein